MSKTLFVQYHDTGFWAFDVAVGIFLKYLIDAAGKRTGGQNATWLNECIDRWRVNAIVSEYGLHLDEKWSEDQVQIIVHLVEEACGELRGRATISAEEMAGWSILDGRGVFPRGHTEFPTAPIVELGHAIRELLVGALLPSPEGTWWFYGAPTGRSTIAKRS